MTRKILHTLVGLVLFSCTACDVVQEPDPFEGNFAATELAFRFQTPDTLIVLDVLEAGGSMEMSLTEPDGARRVEGRLVIPVGVLSDSIGVDQPFTGTWAYLDSLITLGLDQQQGPIFPIPQEWRREGATLRNASVNLSPVPYTVVMERQ